MQPEWLLELCHGQVGKIRNMTHLGTSKIVYNLEYQV
jgi:hypothetical protein